MTTTWRLAASLEQLRGEINTLAPNRSKASDGTIGDTAHASRASRHNPNRAGVVCALDVTDDPEGDCPIHVIAEQLRARPHPNLAYIISNGRVAGRSSGWAWRPYTGSNKHTRHVHFAVGNGPDSAPAAPYDDTTSWGVAVPVTAAPAPAPAPANGGRSLRKGLRGGDVSDLQHALIAAGLLPAGAADGIFGPKTEAAVKELQRRLGVSPDGIVGPKTRAAMAGQLAA
jgi:Putative peptidoglycan binding domain